MLVSFVFLVSCGGATPPKPPPPTPWIVGLWGPRTYAPFTGLVEFKADGTYYAYNNYDGTGGVAASGTWALEGDTLTNGTDQVAITKVSDNEWFEVGKENYYYGHHYRKGYEPGGSVFSQNPTLLTESVSTSVTWSSVDLKLCRFTASSAGNYYVSWSGGGGSDKVVGVYKSDQMTSVFLNQGGQLSSPQTVSLGATEKIFIILYGDTGGPLDIMIQPAP